ncbi:aldehyde dehydrogenase family protein [Ramlibacter sp. AN1015]|uniref:aldehyde dehydrogenase family protein n=1 Tax=Ramlibacter sp. AN1015 TaxID=3133428 RepID=UPI0030C27E4F
MMTSPAINRSHPYIDGKVKLMLIDGKWVTSLSGKVFQSIDLSTGAVLADVAYGGAEDIDLAVCAARRAFQGPWSKFKPFERQQILLKLADLVEKHYEELARLDSLDYGGPLSRTLGRRRRHIGLLRFYAGLTTNITGSTIENSVPGEAFSYTVKEPVGVVGGIFAWNAPLDMLIWKIAPVLATGCSIVIKPPTEAALTPLRFGELLLEAGVPDGVVNLVPGAVEAGAALAQHPGVDKISFTGSTAVGQSIVRASAGNLKRVTVELGGKSPDIVFADADIAAAVPAAAMAVFANAGQVCAAGTRLFVQRSIYEDFLARVTDFARTLKVGDSMDPATDMGPLISARQVDRVIAYMETGVSEGARLLHGGARAVEVAGGMGFFVQPTVFADVTDDMTIAREEIFGPVLSALPFDSVEEVIARSNATAYGLAAGIWTSDISTAHRVARGVRAGSVWVNSYSAMDPAVPFGGYKMSGYGRESGAQHLESFLETKSVTIKLTQ